MRQFRVYGLPAPQGSKAFKGMRGGRPYLAEVSKNVKPWREAVKWAYIEERAKQQWGITPLGGPVKVEIRFFMPRPAKPKYKYPTRGDLDKLTRSTFDALTDVGAIVDDKHVTCLICDKQFCHGEQEPGAAICIKTV